jgi:hypothetical protein
MGAHVINPDQLQLFMTGTELKNAITGSIDRNPIGGFGGTMDKMWKSKLRQSKRSGVGHGAGTYQSLLKHGWQDPGTEGGFEINRKRVYGGIPEWDRTETSVTGAHHRIAAAADIEAKGKRTIYFPTASNQYEYPTIIPEHRKPK